MTGNDLARHRGKALILDILRNLRRLKAMYPVLHIVWLTIIRRLAWRNARNLFPLTQLTGVLTGRFAGQSCTSLGSVIGHQRIHMDRPEFFRNDGIHLSDFIEDIKGGGCFLSLRGLMAGMRFSMASPYAVVCSADITGFLLSPSLNLGKLWSI